MTTPCIMKALASELQEQWPNLHITTWHRTSPINQERTYIHIHYPIENYHLGHPNYDNDKIWIAEIRLHNDTIRLEITPGPPIYQNTLHDPQSITTLITILQQHISNVKRIVPKKLHKPRLPNEPTELEIQAKITRSTYQIRQSLLISPQTFSGENMKLNQIQQDRITISESGLSRLLQHTQQPFAIITAYRDKHSKEENIHRNRSLRHHLNKKLAGVHQLIGHWQECQDPNIPYAECPPEKLKDVVERSYLVPQPPVLSTDEFAQWIHQLGNLYEQDAIVLYDGTTINAIHKDGTHTKLGTELSIGNISQSYSQHVKKNKIPLTFEGIETPTNNIGRTAKTAEGYLFPPTHYSTKEILAESVN